MYFKIIQWVPRVSKSGELKSVRGTVFKTEFVGGTLKQARAKAVSMARKKMQYGYLEIWKFDKDGYQTPVGVVMAFLGTSWSDSYFEWTPTKTIPRKWGAHDYVLKPNGDTGRQIR